MGLLDLRWNILVGYGPLFLQGLAMTLQLTVVALVDVESVVHQQICHRSREVVVIFDDEHSAAFITHFR